MRPEVNLNRFEISRRFENLFCLHEDLTAAPQFNDPTVQQFICVCAVTVFQRMFT